MECRFYKSVYLYLMFVFFHCLIMIKKMHESLFLLILS